MDSPALADHQIEKSRAAEPGFFLRQKVRPYPPHLLGGFEGCEGLSVTSSYSSFGAEMTGGGSEAGRPGSTPDFPPATGACGTEPDGFEDGGTTLVPGFSCEEGTQPFGRSSILMPPGGSCVGSSQPAGRSDFRPSGRTTGAVMRGTWTRGFLGAAGAVCAAAPSADEASSFAGATTEAGALVVGAAGVVGGLGAGAACVAVGAVGIEGLGVAAGTVIVG